MGPKILSLSVKVATSTNAVADAGATPAAVVTVVATTDADLSVVTATSANAVADAEATPAAVVTVAARDADLSVVAATSANAVADAGATPAAVVTVVATTDADLSVVAATSANAVADAAVVTPAAVVTVAATTDADLSVVAATSANEFADAALVTTAAAATEEETEAVISASAVADTIAGTSAQIIKSISDYNPPLDELIRFSTAVVKQLQEKFNNFEKGTSLWTNLQNFSTSQEVVLLSTESEVNALNISHSQSGSGTTSIPQVVAVALVNNLEENDIHIRESILFTAG